MFDRATPCNHPMPLGTRGAHRCALRHGLRQAAFGYAKCGLFLSAGFLIGMCFLAYVTATFEVEAMAIANRVIDRKLAELGAPAHDKYSLKKRAEMGQMAEIVRPRVSSWKQWLALC